MFEFSDLLLEHGRKGRGLGRGFEVGNRFFEVPGLFFETPEMHVELLQRDEVRVFLSVLVIVPAF